MSAAVDDAVVKARLAPIENFDYRSRARSLTRHLLRAGIKIATAASSFVGAIKTAVEIGALLDPKERAVPDSSRPDIDEGRKPVAIVAPSLLPPPVVRLGKNST